MNKFNSGPPSIFLLQNDFKIFAKSLDADLQNIAIARIVGGVLTATGAAYMMLASVGVYSKSGEIGIQLIGLGSLLSAIALFVRTHIDKQGWELVRRFRLAVDDSWNIILPPTTGLDFNLPSYLRCLLFTLVFILYIGVHSEDKPQQVKWLLLLVSFTLMISSSMKVNKLIKDFRNPKVYSRISKICGKCLRAMAIQSSFSLWSRTGVLN